MNDKDKTEGQLIRELEELRQKVAYLETCLDQRKHAEEALQKSESKYRFLYQESPSMSLIIGKEGFLKDANKAALETLGYSHDEVVAKHALDFVVPEEREKTAALLEKAFRGDYIPESNEIEIYAKDGSIHTILFSPGRLVLYEDGDDKSACILVTGVDITERKKMEAAIVEANQRVESDKNRLETLLKTIPSGVVIIERPDGKIAYVNDRAVELYGTDPRGLEMSNHP